MTGDSITNSGRLFFYTCPLKALWMQRYFNMKFEDDYTFPALDDLVDGFSGKYIIHADSHHLLEAQPGDYVLLPDVLGFDVIDQVKEIAKNGNIFTVSYKRPYEPGKQIITRKNTPFMWPESEEM